MDTTTMLQLLSPLVAKLVTDGVKALVPKLPPWSIAFVAILLGGVLSYVGNLVAGGTLPVWGNLLAGLATVGLHEAIEQVKPTPPPA